MLFVGSNDSFDWGPTSESETLEMATVAADVEEGEISNVETVSNGKTKIKKRDETLKDAAAGQLAAGNAKRMWTMRDLYHYQMAGRGYVAGLYNLAWAQAVQNKPLDEMVVEVFEPSAGCGTGDEQGKTKEVSMPCSSAAKGDEMEDNENDIEEGELEEGEIDLDSSSGVEEDQNNIEIARKALENFHLTDLGNSFETGCNHLQNALEALSSFPQKNSTYLVNEIIRMIIVALRAVNLVFVSMDSKLKEENKERFSRLLGLVNTQCSIHLSDQELKELNIMSTTAKNSEALREVNSVELSRNAYNLSVEIPNTKQNFRGRAGLRPLLDLHKDHDIDSLPSPTRETAPPLPPLQRSKPDELAPLKVDSVESKLHPYETDAVKAVSSYQKRFAQNSLFTYDRLPSPTPSYDSGDQNGTDNGEEASSSSVSAIPAPNLSISSEISADLSASTSTGTNLAATMVKPLAKSRDPRLRFLNQDPNPVDNHSGEEPSLKRQRNMPQTVVSDRNIASENIDVVSGNNLMKNSEQLQPAASIPELLKSFAVNPTLLLNILSKGQLPDSNSLPGIPARSGTPTVDEGSKLRMKPRDPRRALHNTLPKPATEDSDSLKSNEDNLPTILPDITSSFTNSLKNIANIVSVSQAASIPPLKPQSLPSSDLAVAASRQQNNWADVEHLFNGYDEKQKAAIQRERARRMEEQRKMFASRKLCLVLDLDHTLLNSAKFTEVEPLHEEILRRKEEQDREKTHRHLFRFPHLGMWTKLRPGIWNFLEKASKLYELHLYTMGNKVYATEMAKVLDPKGLLFSGRVISRGDDGDSLGSEEMVPKSKDLEGVLGLESVVVIIDDSVRVWPHNKLNLIVVERYIYFPCSRRQFGLSGPSLLEIDHDERPEDGTLACSLSVIEKIHQTFYTHPSLEEADVRNILASEQRKILSGCRVVFSRIFPVGEANPQLHPLWQTAEQFGAVCTNQLDDQVTHVVALSFGTDKVNWAFSRGKYIVHPGWVEASALLYRRANEQDFMIKP